MTRPLYRPAATGPTKRNPQGHAGLWYDKFCDRWKIERGTWTMSAGGSRTNPKLDWIETVCDASRQLGSNDQIGEYAKRLVQLVTGRDGKFRVFKTESRFVTGLGQTHPVENGFAWHPTLGTPYLPGSSVKGLVRSWASGHDPTNRDRLLGDKTSVGMIIFLDAVPTTPVGLQADIMTPHYAGWDEKNPPGDWCSPIPVPFLVVGPETPFLFGILPRPGASAEDLKRVMGWLEEALKWLGAGAKTAVGYGRMARDSVRSEQWETRLRQERERRAERRRRASLSPLEQELQTIAEQEGTPDAGHWAWLNELEKGRWADDPDKQHAVAETIKARMQELGQWKETSQKKNPARDKAHQRTLSVKHFLQGDG